MELELIGGDRNIIDTVDDTEKMEILSKSTFKKAFDIYKNIYEELFKQVKNPEIQKILFAMTDTQDSHEMFQIFLDWDSQKFGFPSQVRSLVDTLKQMTSEFGKFMKPIRMPIIEKQLAEMRRKIHRLVSSTVPEGQSLLVENKYNSILSSVLKGATEDNKRLFEEIMNDEKRDHDDRISSALRMWGTDRDKIYMLTEYYNHRKVMLSNVIKFTQEIEDKLIEFVKSFKATDVKSFQANLQKQYLKYKMEINRLISLAGTFENPNPAAGMLNDKLILALGSQDQVTKFKGIFDGQPILKIDGTGGLKEKLQQLALCIIQTYQKNQVFSSLMNIFKDISGIKFDIGEMLNELIVSSVMFSQVQILLYGDPALNKSSIDVAVNIEGRNFVSSRKWMGRAAADTLYDGTKNDEFLNAVKTGANAAAIIGAINVIDIDGGKVIQPPAEAAEFAVTGYLKTAAGTNGILLIYKTFTEDIVMKITQQSIQSIFSTVIVQLQQYLREDKPSLLQVITGGDQGPQPIPQAEMFYTLFVQLVADLKHKFYHEDAVPAKTTFNLTIQLPYSSKFKQAFDFVISRITVDATGVITAPLQYQDFYLLVRMLNEIWKRKTESAESSKSINARTVACLRDFIHDIIEGMAYQTQVSQIDKYQDMFSEPQYKKIVKTVGFDDEMFLQNDPRQEIDIDFSKQIMKEVTSNKGTRYNERYLEFINYLEKDILQTNAKDEFNEDYFEEFKVYLSEYYDSASYRDPRTRAQYIYTKYSTFHSGSAAHEDVFKMKFGTKLYYYLLYAGNVMKTLHKYHTDYVDGVFTNRFYKNDGTRHTEYDDNNRFYEPCLWIAVMAASRSPEEPINKIFVTYFKKILTEIIKPDLGGTGKVTNTKPGGGGHGAMNNVYYSLTNGAGTLQSKFKDAMEKHGIVSYMPIGQKIEQTRQFQIIKAFWSQFEYLVSDQNKLQAYMLNVILNDDDLTSQFFSQCAINNRLEQYFTRILPETTRMGKLMFTIKSQIDSEWDGAKVKTKLKADLDLIKLIDVINVKANTYIGNQVGNEKAELDAELLKLKEQYGEEFPYTDNRDTQVNVIDKITLIKTKLGAAFDILPIFFLPVKNMIKEMDNGSVRKYYLSKKYEDILVGWFYPPQIYPPTQNDLNETIKHIPDKIHLVQYNKGKFEYQKLLEFLDEGKQSIMNSYKEFATSEPNIKKYYEQQLDMTVDMSGLVQAIFEHKIIPCVDPVTYETRQNSDLTPEERQQFTVSFTLKNGVVTEMPEIFQYDNILTVDIPGNMAGLDKKPSIIKTGVVQIDQASFIPNDARANSIIQVNDFMKKVIDIFAMQGKLVQLPSLIIQKFYANSQITKAIQVQSITYKNFTINIPINGVITPFTLPTQSMPTDLKQIDRADDNDALIGGVYHGVVQTREEKINYGALYTRNDVKLIMSMYHILNVDVSAEEDDALQTKIKEDLIKGDYNEGFITKMKIDVVDQAFLQRFVAASVVNRDYIPGFTGDCPILFYMAPMTLLSQAWPIIATRTKDPIGTHTFAGVNKEYEYSNFIKRLMRGKIANKAAATTGALNGADFIRSYWSGTVEGADDISGANIAAKMDMNAFNDLIAGAQIETPDPAVAAMTIPQIMTEYMKQSFNIHDTFEIARHFTNHFFVAPNVVPYQDVITAAQATTLFALMGNDAGTIRAAANADIVNNFESFIKQQEENIVYTYMACGPDTTLSISKIFAQIGVYIERCTEIIGANVRAGNTLTFAYLGDDVVDIQGEQIFDNPNAGAGAIGVDTELVPSGNTADKVKAWFPEVANVPVWKTLIDRLVDLMCTIGTPGAANRRDEGAILTLKKLRRRFDVVRFGLMAFRLRIMELAYWLNITLPFTRAQASIIGHLEIDAVGGPFNTQVVPHVSLDDFTTTQANSAFYGVRTNLNGAIISVIYAGKYGSHPFLVAGILDAMKGDGVTYEQDNGADQDAITLYMKRTKYINFATPFNKALQLNGLDIANVLNFAITDVQKIAWSLQYMGYLNESYSAFYSLPELVASLIKKIDKVNKDPQMAIPFSNDILLDVNFKQLPAIQTIKIINFKDKRTFDDDMIQDFTMIAQKYVAEQGIDKNQFLVAIANFVVGGGQFTFTTNTTDSVTDSFYNMLARSQMITLNIVGQPPLSQDRTALQTGCKQMLFALFVKHLALYQNKQQNTFYSSQLINLMNQYILSLDNFYGWYADLQGYSLQQFVIFSIINPGLIIDPINFFVIQQNDTSVTGRVMPNKLTQFINAQVNLFQQNNIVGLGDLGRLIYDFDRNRQMIMNSTKLSTIAPTIKLNNLYFIVDAQIGKDNKVISEQIQKFRKSAVDEQMKKIFIQSFIYDESSKTVKEFAQSNPYQCHFQDQLLYMHNIYALLKQKDLTYNTFDKISILQDIFSKNIIQDIQNTLLNQSLTDNAKSVLNHLKQMCMDFVEENKSLYSEKILKLDKEYDDYEQKYSTFLGTDEVFKLEKLFKAGEAFYNRLMVDAYFKIHSPVIDAKVDDIFKKLWYNLAVMVENKAAPKTSLEIGNFAKTKLSFVRFADTSNEIGIDHAYVGADVDNENPDFMLSQFLFEDLYKDNAYQDMIKQYGNTPAAHVKANKETVLVQHKLYKMLSEMSNVPEQLNLQLYNEQNGLKMRVEYQQLLDKDLIYRKMIPEDNDETTVIKTTAKNVGEYFGDGDRQSETAGKIIPVEYKTLEYPEQVQILTTGSAYKQFGLAPNQFTYWIRRHAGITEPDILRASSTICLGNVHLDTPGNFISYIGELRQLFTGKTLQHFNTNFNYIYRVIGLDPINPVSLIKRYVSFPLINIMNLYAHKYLAQYEIRDTPSLKWRFKVFEEDYKIDLAAATLTKDATHFVIKDTQLLQKPFERFLWHICFNAEYLLDQIKDKRKPTEKILLNGQKIQVTPIDREQQMKLVDEDQ